MSGNMWRGDDGTLTPTHHRGMHYLLTGMLVITLSILVGWTVWPRPQVHGDIPVAVTEQKVPDGVPTIGQPAPNFTLPALHHAPQSLAAWRGHPVLINFWASWCGPCRREMPALVAAYEDYQEAGLVILAVNLTHLDSRANAEAFAEQFQIPFPVLFDHSGEVADYLYGARALPMSFFIDRAGNVQHIYVGAVNSAWIEQVMTETLAE